MQNKHISALMMIFGLGMTLSLESLATCNAAVTATAPDSRYTDNGNGTVTDNQTGLMWRQCSEGQSSTSTACDTGTAIDSFTWQQALQQAESLNNSGGFAGYTDWRLPNRNELASLVERQCYRPAINENLFPSTSFLEYWSSSPSIYVGTTDVWYVDFDGGLVFTDFKTTGHSVRFVRGGL